VTLEEAEYRFLKARAAESGASLSSVVRELVRERMECIAAASPHVGDLAGLITQSDFSGEDHDAVIYGRPTSGGAEGADGPGAR